MDVVYRLQGVEFEWDAQKSQRNVEHHGVTFEEAAGVFFDPFYQYGDATPPHTDEQRDFVGCRAEGDAAQDEIACVTFGDLFSRNHRSLGKSATFCVARAARRARTFQKCELSGAGSSM